MNKPKRQYFYDYQSVKSYLAANGFDERLFQEFMRDQSAGGYGLGQNTIVNLEFTDILWDDGKDYTGKPDYMVPRVRSMSPELKSVLEFLQKEFGDCVSLKFWW